MTSRHIRLTRLQTIAKGASPENYLFERPHNYLDPRWIEEQSIEACFYGSGGDNVFFQPHTRFGAVDYAVTRGLGRGLIGAAMDAARLNRSSLWSVLRSSIAARFRRRHGFPFHVLSSARSALIPTDVWNALDAAAALPRSLAAANLPPGKQLHVSIATSCPSYYEPLEPQESFLERVTPLFSQPLVELCLRIPIWVLCANGRDRGLARMTFADRLPPQIIGRESKGGADRLIEAALTEHVDFVRGMLLEGVLAEQRLLDRQALEQVLCRRDPECDAEIVNVLFLLCAEAWARHWIESSALGDDNSMLGDSPNVHPPAPAGTLSS